MVDETLKACVRAGYVALIAAVVSLGGATVAAAQATEGSSESGEGEATEGTEGEAAPDAPADAPPGDATPAEGTAEETDEESSGQAQSEGSSGLSSGHMTDEEIAEREAEENEGEGGEAVAEEAQAQREPFPWRNSFFSWTHGVTPNSFFRDAQLSYNPVYYWSFSLTPRWYLDPATFFFLSQGLSYELTNDDGSSSYNHDVQLSDTIVELRRTIAWEGFIFIPAGRVTLPASKASQASERYFQLGAGLTAVRVIPEAAALTIAVIGRYQYWFAGSNVARTMGDAPGQTAPPVVPNTPSVSPEGVVDAPTIDQASGSTTARHIVVAGLSLNITPFEGFNVSLSGFWVSQEAHGLATGCVDTVLTSPDGAVCLPDQSATHWRHFTSLSLSLAYDIQPWLNLSVGWSNASVLAPFFGPDGNVLGPFNPDNNFFLTATVQLDALYEAIAGGEDDGLTPEQRQRRRQGLAFGSSSGGSL